MELVGQRIHHRHSGDTCHLFDTGLLERAPHDAVGHACQHFGGVGNRLSAAKLRTGLVDDQG